MDILERLRKFYNDQKEIEPDFQKVLNEVSLRYMKDKPTKHDRFKTENNMVVYSFLYCPCIYESSYQTISLHKTKRGAYNAMRKYLIDNYLEWDEKRRQIKKWQRYYHYNKFGIDQKWAVQTVKIEE